MKLKDEDKKKVLVIELTEAQHAKLKLQALKEETTMKCLVLKKVFSLECKRGEK